MPVRTLIATALLLCFLQACAYSMVDGDRVREDAFDDVLSRTAVARDLPIPERYDTKVIDRDAIQPLLREIIIADWPPEALADYQETLVSIGVWPPTRDLVDEYVAVSQEELAGLYVPNDATLYVVRDATTPFLVDLASAMARRDLMRELILAHELVHLLQHGAYPQLMEDDADWRDQDDATSAVHAALEGDATRFGMVAVVGSDAPLPDPTEFRENLEAEQQAGDGALARSPALLRLTLAFPYGSGYALSVNEGAGLLDDPPASTEQVLHPEQRHADFTAIDLAGVRDTLPAGCRWLGDNTLGELGISVLLRDLGEEPDPAAWEGWDGDRYLAARCGPRRAFVWETYWDSDADAAEFAEAYAGIARAVGQRADLAGLPEIRLGGRRVRIVSAPLAPLGAGLEARARRGRVATLPELRRHFGVPYRDR